MLASVQLTSSNVIALAALALTVGSFWALNARRGPLLSTPPRAYAFGGSGDLLRLRFPLVLFNTGALAYLICDLRLVVESEQGSPTLRWVTTRSQLRPASHDGHAFATPFAIRGRDSRELIAEFEPSPASTGHRLKVSRTSSDSKRSFTSAADTSGSTS